jgi:hypothetical protein
LNFTKTSKNTNIERKEIDEDEITTDNQQGSNKSTSGTNFSNDERQYLQEKLHFPVIAISIYHGSLPL